MASNTPKKVDKKVINANGSTKAKTTEKGPHGGGTKYDQMAVGTGFAVHGKIPGHSQKKNVD